MEQASVGTTSSPAGDVDVHEPAGTVEIDPLHEAREKYSA